MEKQRFSANGFSARLYSCNTAVVGTGAAGYNAADRLWQLGQRDIPTSVLIQLAAFHKTSVDYLLELTDLRTPYPRRQKE